MAKEPRRVKDARDNHTSWHKWGPYLSERQWGTVREDYSSTGDAWDYFSHDQARSRAYHWGEDGLAGISDDNQFLCFSVALWNGKDPILKERLFGLTNREGNHGEDVKEYYFYLDSTPTHSYMKYLYKYPQRAYPYGDLIATNMHRNRNDPEYELIDTGIFDDDRYFDVFVEYAKENPEDILIQVTVCNRGPATSTIHLLPTLWFRNTWSWSDGAQKPLLKQVSGTREIRTIAASHPVLGERFLYCDGAVPVLFTENETNNERLFGTSNAGPFVKDGINDYVVSGRQNAVRPDSGTKCSPYYMLDVKAGAAATIWLRLSDRSGAAIGNPFGKAFAETIAARRSEADEFYKALTPAHVTRDAALVMRQALAGMLWSKQFFYYDVEKWLAEHGVDPFESTISTVRNDQWSHLSGGHILSMPDKWEYPWFAAWDLAFHTVALSLVDPAFAKEQLDLLLQQQFLHPSGQIPAYEWNFGDVNPPVHAWAVLFNYRMDHAQRGIGDTEFLKRSFRKLLLNYTWWLNRKDRFGKNVFEGGFLGLDNIGVFDRSAPLPGGGYLEQADGTAWMALFTQNMMEIAVELTAGDPSYEDMVIKFGDHLLSIARSMNQTGYDGMWDEEDGFYYDVLRLPDGSATRLKVRSMVGLLPLCATTVIEPAQRDIATRATAYLRGRLERMPELMESIHATGPGHLGVDGRGIIALVNETRLRRMLTRMLDENEFLGAHGIRAISRSHLEHPYVFGMNGQKYKVNYLPAESDTGMFGGNSNWRGPVWMPVNVMIIRALLSYHAYYGDGFKIECPTGSGTMMNLFEVAHEISNRLTSIFLRDASGRRPVFGGAAKFQSDPHWKDYLLFYEYFHGDNGAGIGASHQTGWTGLVANLIHLFGRLSAQQLATAGKSGVFAAAAEEHVRTGSHP